MNLLSPMLRGAGRRAVGGGCSGVQYRALQQESTALATGALETSAITRARGDKETYKGPIDERRFKVR